MHCPKFVNQQQRCHLDGKSVADVSGDEINIDTHVGYVQVVEIFKEI